MWCGACGGTVQRGAALLFFLLILLLMSRVALGVYIEDGLAALGQLQLSSSEVSDFAAYKQVFLQACR